MSVYLYCVVIVFFFKQKTAYEMRISDWSSDVCSSDLSKSAIDSSGRASSGSSSAPIGGIASLNSPSSMIGATSGNRTSGGGGVGAAISVPTVRNTGGGWTAADGGDCACAGATHQARKRVVEGKRVSVSVDLGGRRIITKKTKP